MPSVPTVPAGDAAVLSVPQAEKLIGGRLRSSASAFPFARSQRRATYASPPKPRTSKEATKLDSACRHSVATRLLTSGRRKPPPRSAACVRAWQGRLHVPAAIDAQDREWLPADNPFGRRQKPDEVATLNRATMVAMRTPRIWIFPLVLCRSGDRRKRAAQFGARGARARPQCSSAARRLRLFAQEVRVFRVLAQVIV